MKRKELSIGVIGGGIGGLAAALSLLREGLDVHVYERAKKLSEVGAGIQVSPNASRVLHGLGLADALANMGVKPLAIHQRRWVAAVRTSDTYSGSAKANMPGAFGVRRVLRRINMHHSRLCAVLVDCKTSDVDEAAGFWSRALGRAEDSNHPGTRSSRGGSPGALSGDAGAHGAALLRGSSTASRISKKCQSLGRIEARRAFRKQRGS